MKLFLICLIAGVLVTFLSGCAGDSGYYTQSQLDAQHAGYDPTPHVYGTRY
ncbi:MAG: hypothetical protein ACXWHF_08045 [Chthoniobacterales bacterium]